MKMRIYKDRVEHLGLSISSRMAQNAAREMEDQAKADVPVDTGALRDSLEGIATEDTAQLVSPLDYAMLVELGTRNQAPQPYARPALDRIVSDVGSIAGVI